MEHWNKNTMLLKTLGSQLREGVLFTQTSNFLNISSSMAIVAVLVVSWGQACIELVIFCMAYYFDKIFLSFSNLDHWLSPIHDMKPSLGVDSKNLTSAVRIAQVYDEFSAVLPHLSRSENKSRFVEQIVRIEITCFMGI
jgi:hypothetical protein